MDSDVALLARYAQKGDPLAFNELAVRYRQMVFSAARRITGNHHDAEDVTQACFLELARRASVVRESLAGWLHHQATSRSIDLCRQTQTRERHEQALARQDTGTDLPRWDQIGPMVDAAIEELSEELRVPLILYFLQGLSQDEIGEVLSLSQRTVSRRIQTGLDALRKIIGGKGVVASAGVLGFLLKQNALLATPGSLNISLVKIGLAGIGTIGTKSATQASPLAWLASLGSPISTALLVKVALPLVILLGIAGFVAGPEFFSNAPVSPYEQLADAYRPFMPEDPLAFPAKMRALTIDRSAFLRGADDLVLEWTQTHAPEWFTDPSRFVLSSGGVHIANVGSYPAGTRLGAVAVGLTDFDHVSRMPFEVDLLRGMMSLLIAADESGLRLDDAGRDRTVATFLDAYRRGLRGERSLAPNDPMRLIVTYQADRKVYADELSDYVGANGRFRRLVGRPAQLKDILRPAMHDRGEIAEALEQAVAQSPAFAGRLRLRTASDFDAAILDVARRTHFDSASNQGLAKYLVLLRQPLVDANHDAILYLKQQIPTPAERLGIVPVDPRTPGRRVAESITALSDPDPFIVGWCELEGRSFSIHLREPWSREIDPASLGTLDRLFAAAALLGESVGRMHRHDENASGIPARLTPGFEQLLLERAVACVGHLTDLHAALRDDPRARQDILAVESAMKSWIARTDAIEAARSINEGTDRG